MSPIRKSDDYRATEIKSWDEYVQDEIAGMEARGEMKDLPQQGKPIKIWQTQGNQEYDLAFSRMKNAGVKPAWMELDTEISRLTDELWARLDAIERSIRSSLDQLRDSGTREPEVQPQRGFMQRIRDWFRFDLSEDAPPPASITDIMASRDRERLRFMELAAKLDKKIDEFHNSLPKGGEHLQRLRWLPERAAKVFDERIALSTWWEEVRAEHT